MIDISLALQASDELQRLGRLLHQSGTLPEDSWPTLFITAGMLIGIAHQAKKLQSDLELQTSLASSFRDQCVKAYEQVDALGAELTWLREHKPHTFNDYVRAHPESKEAS